LKLKYKTAENGPFIAVARFLPLDNFGGISTVDLPEMDEYVTLETGDLVPYKTLLKHIRDADNPFLPFYKGKFLGSQQNTATFEFKEKAWHYGWKGGRYKQSMLHELRVYIFHCPSLTPADGDMIECVQTIRSPTFTVYSSRSAPKPDLLEIPHEIHHQSSNEKLSSVSDPDVESKTEKNIVNNKRRKADDDNSFFVERYGLLAQPNQYSTLYSISPAIITETDLIHSGPVRLG